LCQVKSFLLTFNGLAYFYQDVTCVGGARKRTISLIKETRINMFIVNILVSLV